MAMHMVMYCSTLVLNKDIPSSPHYLACSLMNLKHICLDLEHAYKEFLNKLYEFCTSSSLEVNLSKTKIMIFDRNKRELIKKAFYLGKDPIEITHEYKYLGIDFCSHV